MDASCNSEASAIPSRGRLPGIHRFMAAVREAFAPSGIAGDPYLKVTRALYRVHVLVGVFGLAFYWILPAHGSGDRRTYLLLVGGIFLPYSLVLLYLSKRSEHAAIRITLLAADLMILFLFQTLLPVTRLAAMFGYILILAFYASLGGVIAGMLVSAAIMGLVICAEIVLRPAAGFGGYTLFKYGLVLVAMSNLLDTVTVEQRRANRRLAALLESLRYVSSSLELPAVLDALARSVKDSLKAAYADVILTDEPPAGDSELTASPGSPLAAVTPAWVRNSAQVAMDSRRLVVVDDAAVRGLPAGPDLYLRSLIAIPLLADGRPIGVLNAGFTLPRQVGEGERDLVSAYAEQATAAVLRARSYERAKRAEEEIKRLNADLERRVEKRTAELKRTQAELHSQLEVTMQQAMVLAEMSKRIAGARDEERQRLARDLHDGIQQQLVMLRMNLTLRQSNGSGVAGLEEELDRIIERMREVAQDIYPSILLDRGLTAAVHSYAGRLTLSTRLVTCPDPLPRLDPQVEGTAYFVLCEAVTNALKHSRGSELSIALTLGDGVLTLVVRDDGQGFPADAPSNGRGLVYMRDRVRSFGGELTVGYSGPRGTEVRAVIPVGSGSNPAS